MMTIFKTNFSGVNSMIKTVILTLNVFILRIARDSVTGLDFTNTVGVFSYQMGTIGFIYVLQNHFIIIFAAEKNVFSKDPHSNVIYE